MSSTPDDMVNAMIANLPDKTGKSLDEWLAIVDATDYRKHGEIVSYLKAEQGMTHGYAGLVSQLYRQRAEGPPPGEEDLVEAQYAKKEGLRPIYEALVARVAAFGEDVDVSPRKTYVSLRRSKQFGILKPSTKTRMDVGIQLKGEPSTARLEEGSRFGGMVSHQVAVTELAEVDEELLGWLEEAYRRA